MSDSEPFGLRMRAAREQRGISLATIAKRTKVRVSVWEALERGDFSNWPSGLFARAYVRDYALLVGLDPKEMVDELCRLVPAADRRVQPLMGSGAAIVGVEPAYRDECLPPEGDRREPPPPPKRRFALLSDARAQRGVGGLCDLAAVLGLSSAVNSFLGTEFLVIVGMMALAYYSVGTLVFGRSLGLALASLIGKRPPDVRQMEEGRSPA